MRVRGLHLQQVLLGAALLAALLWNLAKAAEIKDLRLTAGPTGTRAELALDARAEFKLSAPALNATMAPDTRTFTYSIIHSDNAIRALTGASRRGGIGRSSGGPRRRTGAAAHQKRFGAGRLHGARGFGTNRAAPEMQAATRLRWALQPS